MDASEAPSATAQAATPSKAEAEQTAAAGTPTVKAPQKRFFRQRAHCNPFSDHQID